VQVVREATECRLEKRVRNPYRIRLRKLESMCKKAAVKPTEHHCALINEAEARSESVQLTLKALSSRSGR
jgi:hypothetical protein